VLASGSSGNAALLATENTRILVDAGMSMRELRKRLADLCRQLAGAFCLEVGEALGGALGVVLLDDCLWTPKASWTMAIAPSSQYWNLRLT